MVNAFWDLPIRKLCRRFLQCYLIRIAGPHPSLIPLQAFSIIRVDVEKVCLVGSCADTLVHLQKVQQCSRSAFGHPNYDTLWKDLPCNVRNVQSLLSFPAFNCRIIAVSPCESVAEFNVCIIMIPDKVPSLVKKVFQQLLQDSAAL